MKKLINLFSTLLCVTVISTSALATEAQNTNIIPAYMAAPGNTIYPGNISPAHALGASNTSYVMGSLNLAFGLEEVVWSTLFDNYNFCRDKDELCEGWGLQYIPHVIITSAVFLRTAITVPIANHSANKTNAWHLYNKHRTYDAVMWTFYGLSLAWNIYAGHTPLFQFPNLQAALAYNISITLASALLSAVPLFLVAIKAKRSYQMANAANNYNQNHATESTQDNLTVLPTVSPYLDRNNKLSGGTIGVALNF